MKPEAPRPLDPATARIAADAKRAMKLQMRRLARRTNAATRRKRPPKALAEIRAMLGRLEAALDRVR